MINWELKKSNYIVNDHFDVNKDLSLLSMKHIFDNDLNVVKEHVFNKFFKIYSNIEIYHVKRNEMLIRMDMNTVNNYFFHFRNVIKLSNEKINNNDR